LTCYWEAGGLNLYVYCDNNPVSFRDPFGLKAGDLYHCAQEAAIAALDEYGPTAKVEYGGGIYSIQNKPNEMRFSYTTPESGSKTRVDLGPALGRAQALGTLVGSYHLHVVPLPTSYNFSASDDLPAFLRLYKKGYTTLQHWLLTPDQTVLRFDPVWEKSRYVPEFGEVYEVDRKNPCGEGGRR
jgi:hypothetical protein